MWCREPLRETRLQMFAQSARSIHARPRRGGIARAPSRCVSIEQLDHRVLLSMGDLDATFRGGGKFTHDFGFGNDSGYAMQLLSDGRFLVAGTVRGANGTNDFGLARFLADGSLDTSFGINGMITTDFGATSGATSSDEVRAMTID